MSKRRFPNPKERHFLACKTEKRLEEIYMNFKGAEKEFKIARRFVLFNKCLKEDQGPRDRKAKGNVKVVLIRI